MPGILHRLSCFRGLWPGTAGGGEAEAQQEGLGARSVCSLVAVGYASATFSEHPLKTSKDSSVPKNPNQEYKSTKKSLSVGLAELRGRMVNVQSKQRQSAPSREGVRYKGA